MDPSLGNLISFNWSRRQLKRRPRDSSCSFESMPGTDGLLECSCGLLRAFYFVFLLPRPLLHACGVCPCMNLDSPCSWMPQKLQVIVPAPRFPTDISHIPQTYRQRGRLHRVLSGRLRLALRHDNLILPPVFIPWSRDP